MTYVFKCVKNVAQLVCLATVRFGLLSTLRRRFHQRKQSFLKTLSKVDTFENTVFASQCG